MSFPKKTNPEIKTKKARHFFDGGGGISHLSRECRIKNHCQKEMKMVIVVILVPMRFDICGSISAYY